MYLIHNEQSNINQQTPIDIKEYIRQMLMEQNIIDIRGNILNVLQYCRTIESEKNKRLKSLKQIPLLNTRIIDSSDASVLFSEIEFLNNIEAHKKNFYDSLEYPRACIPPKQIDRTVWEKVDRMRRKMLVTYRRRFR